MREIKPQFVNKKTDKSMFLDKMYGGNRNDIITMDHIRRNIKFLFRDIARGSVTNPKFEEALKIRYKNIAICIRYACIWY